MKQNQEKFSLLHLLYQGFNNKQNEKSSHTI